MCHALTSMVEWVLLSLLFICVVYRVCCLCAVCGSSCCSCSCTASSAKSCNALAVYFALGLPCVFYISSLTSKAYRNGSIVTQCFLVGGDSVCDLSCVMLSVLGFFSVMYSSLQKRYCWPACAIYMFKITIA